MKRFVIFVGVGGMATLIQFAILALLVESGLTTAVVASGTSYGLSAIFNYLANYHLTFASKISHKQTFPKFAFAAALGLVTSTSLFALFLHLIGYYLLAQCLATGLTLILNFAVHKLWIYRNH